MFIIYAKKEAVAKEMVEGVPGGMSWVATYTNDCVLEDIRKIDAAEQKKRDDAIAQRSRKTNRPQGSGEAPVSGPDTLFNLTGL